MKLQLFERIQICLILPDPSKESFLKYKVLKDIILKLYPSEEENELYEIKTENITNKEGINNISFNWNEKGANTEFIYDFSIHEIKYLKDLFIKLIKQDVLPPQLNDLCETRFNIDAIEILNEIEQTQQEQTES